MPSSLRRLRRSALVTLAAALGLAAGGPFGCASTRPTSEATAPAGTPIDSALALETFDVVWTTIDTQHFDPTHNGVDWKAVRDEFRPQAAVVATNEELRDVLGSMIARLGQSHFGIIPGEVANPTGSGGADGGTTVSTSTGTAANETSESSNEDDGGGDLGMLLRLVGEEIVVVAPQPGGPADRAGIRAGWSLVSVDGRDPRRRLPSKADLESPLASPMLRFVAEQIAAGAAATAPGRTRTLVFEDLAGTRHTVSLTAGSFGGELVKFGNLPPLETHVAERSIGSAELAAAGVDAADLRIGYITFNIWMIAAAPAFDKAVDVHRSADGLVVDLRGNPGGLGGMAMGFGGHFLDREDSLGRMTNRETSLEFRVNPRRVTADGRVVAPYAGPVAILVDPLTASTSEIFAAGLQELGRVVVVGQTTAGAALPSIAMALPNGDVLQYAMADFITPKGNRIEGRGVPPDLAVALDRTLLSREPDPVLAAALRHLAAERRAASPTS
jgi:carboxyl-terminal processing protease